MLLKLEILKFLKNNFVYLGLTLFQTAESFFISILTDFLGVTYRERERERLGADHRKKRRCPPAVIVMPWELEKRPALPLRSSYYTNIVIALWHFAPYHSLNWLSVKLHAEIDSTHQDYAGLNLNSSHQQSSANNSSHDSYLGWHSFSKTLGGLIRNVFV